MSRTFGYVLFTVGLLALIAAGVWLLSGPGADDAPPPRPPYALPVTLAEVALGDVQPTAELTGTARSARWTRLAFETSGLLVALAAAEAESVAEGAVLARLDDRDETLAVTRAEADLEVAQRRLERLEAGEREEVKARLLAELEAARAEEQLAVLEVDRRRPLLLADDVSKAEMDRAQADRRAATARREAAEQRLIEARAGTRAEDLAVARAELSGARAALEVARRALEKTVLRAPWDGSIVRRAVSVGDYLTPGQAVFELADLRHLEIDVEIPARHALHLGGAPRVALRVDEAPGFVHETRLDAAIGAADRLSRNFRGIVRLDTVALGRDVLRPGMFVRLTLRLAPLAGAIVVPTDAVRVTSDGPIVVRVARGQNGGGPTGEWIPVRVLGADATGTAVEPLSGALLPGDRIVLTGVDLAWPDVALLPRESDAAGDAR